MSESYLDHNLRILTHIDASIKDYSSSYMGYIPSIIMLSAASELEFIHRLDSRLGSITATRSVQYDNVHYRRVLLMARSRALLMLLQNQEGLKGLIGGPVMVSVCDSTRMSKQKGTVQTNMADYNRRRTATSVCNSVVRLSLQTEGIMPLPTLHTENDYPLVFACVRQAPMREVMRMWEVFKLELRLLMCNYDKKFKKHEFSYLHDFINQLILFFSFRIMGEHRDSILKFVGELGASLESKDLPKGVLSWATVDYGACEVNMEVKKGLGQHATSIDLHSLPVFLSRDSLHFDSVATYGSAHPITTVPKSWKFGDVDKMENELRKMVFELGKEKTTAKDINRLRGFLCEDKSLYAEQQCKMLIEEIVLGGIRPTPTVSVSFIKSNNKAINMVTDKLNKIYIQSNKYYEK
eukprot:GHVR01085585.1.p1 GENE.GHVR01085585.1~~GHVR01085585.1.p1  ORF type:complete len:449 (+),score=48.22 GHVR01085585.1:125-1348(+)